MHATAAGCSESGGASSRSARGRSHAEPAPRAMGLWELFTSPVRGRSWSGGSSPASPARGAPASPGKSGGVRFDWASATAVQLHTPKLLGSDGAATTSQVLSPFALQQLAAASPSRFAFADWRLLYSTAVHGISLNTLYTRCAGCGCCVLAIKDRSGRVFGAFCTEWKEPSPKPSFYGSGETFLFAVEDIPDLPPLPSSADTPPPSEAVHVHRWTGANSYFMLSHRDHLAIGSGGHFGLWLDAELLHGSSGPSTTFGNPCLCRPPAPLVHHSPVLRHSPHEGEEGGGGEADANQQGALRQHKVLFGEGGGDGGRDPPPPPATPAGQQEGVLRQHEVLFGSTPWQGRGREARPPNSPPPTTPAGPQGVLPKAGWHGTPRYAADTLAREEAGAPPALVVPSGGPSDPRMAGSWAGGGSGVGGVFDGMSPPAGSEGGEGGGSTEQTSALKTPGDRSTAAAAGSAAGSAAAAGSASATAGSSSGAGGAPAAGDEADVGEFDCHVLEVWGMDHTTILRRQHEQSLKGMRPR